VDQRTAWQEAIRLPGANQMRHARALIESRPFLTRIPDQSLIAGDALADADHIQATRDAAGSCGFIYSASGKPFMVNLSKLSGNKLRASWFDPRTGGTTLDGEFRNTRTARAFTPPGSGPGSDWVLLLDDVARGFPIPGAVKQ
jgi:hypothetical protein